MAEKSSAPSSSNELDQLAATFAKNPLAIAGEYGSALVAAGRAKEAAQKLGDLHDKQPLSGAARVALAQAYFDTFRLDEAELLIRGEPRLMDKNPTALRVLGEIALEHDRRNEATDFLQRAHALNPNDRRTNEALAVLGVGEAGEEPPPPSTMALMTTLKKAAATLAVLLVVVAIYAWRVRVEDRVTKIVAQAKTDKQKNDFASLQKAEGEYQEALSLQGGNKAALGGIAEVYTFLYTEHGIEDAKAKMTSAAERAADKDVNSGERFLAEAMSLLSGGQAVKAESLLQETIKKGGIDAKVFFALGEVQKALGEPALAIESLRRAYELDPYQPAMAAELGDLYLISGDVKNADFFYRKGADANPAHVRASARALWTKLLMGADAASLKARLSELAAVAEKTSPAHEAAYKALLGEVAMSLGDKSKAIELAQGAARARPQDPALLWELAELELKAGQLQGVAGIKDLEERYGKSAGMTMDAATALQRMGKAADAEAFVRSDKDLVASTRGQAFLAQLQLSSGNVVGAQATIDGAAKVEPGNPDVLYAEGRVAQVKKDDSKALDFYSRALGARQNFPEVYHQVANIYVDNKDYDNAHKNFAVAEKLYKQTAVAPQTLNALYEDWAKSFDKQGGKDAKPAAAKLRARFKKV